MTMERGPQGIAYARHGSGAPMLMMHGPVGLDHSYLRPWLDPLRCRASDRRGRCADAPRQRSRRLDRAAPAVPGPPRCHSPLAHRRPRKQRPLPLRRGESELHRAGFRMAPRGHLLDSRMTQQERRADESSATWPRSSIPGPRESPRSDRRSAPGAARSVGEPLTLPGAPPSCRERGSRADEEAGNRFSRARAQRAAVRAASRAEGEHRGAAPRQRPDPSQHRP